MPRARKRQARRNINPTKEVIRDIMSINIIEQYPDGFNAKISFTGPPVQYNDPLSSPATKIKNNPMIAVIP